MSNTLFDFEEYPGFADISEDGRYRYTLWRTVGVVDRLVNFILLNPSTADGKTDDPTVRRCIGYALAWGFGDLVITNLFALRSTDPAALSRAEDPIGPDNDVTLLDRAARASLVVCGWGFNARKVKGWGGRHAVVLRNLIDAGIRPHALKLTGTGDPGHPLYLSAALKPFPIGGPS